MAIHIIDDDAFIIEVLAELLLTTGRKVSCFRSAEDYVVHMTSEAYAPPSLILTDVRMGAMNGFELVERVRTVSPQIRIMVMSGYFDTHTAVGAPMCHLIRKPFDAEHLLSLVAHALACDGPCPGACTVLASTVHSAGGWISRA